MNLLELPNEILIIIFKKCSDTSVRKLRKMIEFKNYNTIIDNIINTNFNKSVIQWNYIYKKAILTKLYADLDNYSLLLSYYSQSFNSELLFVINLCSRSDLILINHINKNSNIDTILNKKKVQYLCFDDIFGEYNITSFFNNFMCLL